MDASQFIFVADFEEIKRWKPDLLAMVPHGISTVPELFAALRNALGLPDYFGHNWDALHECLRDLHWLPQRRIMLAHEELPRLGEHDLRKYLIVLADSSLDWKPGDEHELLVVFPESACATISAL